MSLRILQTVLLPDRWPVWLAFGPCFLSRFVDGLNPCSLAVLAYFVGVVLANQSRRHALVMGAFYVLSVYVIYLAIGIGLIRMMLLAGLVRRSLELSEYSSSDSLCLLLQTHLDIVSR